MTSPAPDTAPTPDRRPEPVLTAATAASALTSLAGVVLLVLVVAHVLTPAGSAVLGPALATAIPTVVGAAATLWAAWRSRARVLPLADPRVAAAWAQILDAEQTVAGAAARTPGQPQRPGIADHAAPAA